MRLDFAPAMGAAILGWTYDGLNLFRDISDRAGGDLTVRDCASFPLIPFSNRIAKGEFSFDGQSYILPRDVRDPRHAMHGNALYAPWDVTSITRDAVRLYLAYRPDSTSIPFFPFAYDAEQTYRVDGNSLQIDLKICNRDARRFPAGLGHHLYFSRYARTRLAFQAGSYWLNDDQGIPLRLIKGSVNEFEVGHIIGSKLLDNCFEDWPGSATIWHPEIGMQIRISATKAFGHVVLFTPLETAYFAFEPVSHLSDAVHRQQASVMHGLQILEPGHAMDGSIAITVTKTPIGRNFEFS